MISRRYYEYSKTHPVGAALANDLLAAVDANPRLERRRDPDDSSYADAVDARLGNLWRQFYAKPWQDGPAAEALVPTMDEWANHVVHAVQVAGPTHVAIGLDLTQGRSTLKNFDARRYGQLAEVLKRRNVPSGVLGENWMRILDSAKAP